jgi:hypothetical protein
MPDPTVENVCEVMTRAARSLVSEAQSGRGYQAKRGRHNDKRGLARAPTQASQSCPIYYHSNFSKPMI